MNSTVSQADLEAIANCLRDGGVVLLPTETVYGLVTRWDSQRGRDRIYELKHRPPAKPLQMLARDLEQAAAAGVHLTEPLRRLAAAYWPGPLTAIVAAEGQYPTVALRIADYDFLHRLQCRCDFPLAATSANRSGEPPATCFDDAIGHLAAAPDICLDGGVITVTNGLASTIVDLTGDTPKLLREGIITLEDIRRTLADG